MVESHLIIFRGSRRFDVWSAGVTALQVALPFMRRDDALRNFGIAYKRLNYSMDAWRQYARLSARDSAPLDAGDGAGAGQRPLLG